jgi:phosphotransferase system enzyme I (PtsI)
LLHHARDGMTAIVDGRQGLIILNPLPSTLKTYEDLASQIAERRKELRRLRGLKSITADGTPIRLMANLDMPMEAAGAISAGAEGVGLLRTEFMFMRRADLPDEAEQYTHLRSVVQAMEGRPVTIRTLDVGGDKIAAALSHYHDPEANPALGLRAIRLSLHEPELLETQFAAILRASVYGPVRIMLPLVTHIGEVERARRLLEIVARRLRRRKSRIPDRLPPLGVMIETPAAALIAEELANVSDFFALGTNDLTQYTLAVDRSNEQVASIYDPLHPAVLKLVKMTVEAAAARNIPVSVCGEMAGDARVTAMLLQLGIRELSMSSAMLPTVKKQIRGLHLVSA